MTAPASSAANFARLFDELPLPCRMVDGKGHVVWESLALRNLLHTRAEAGCCESLGFLHREGSCPSLRTIRTGAPQDQTRWLGRVYLAMHTVALSGIDGGERLSFECFQDVTPEKRLEAAFTQQQELLEAINKAMIEINHHLESAQNELEEKNHSLQQANAQLRSLDQMKDEFISIVSHELKAPLTSIKGSVDLIRNSERYTLSPTGQELLSVCRRNVDRLHGLVQDLLEIARIESGRLSLGFSAFNARAMAEEALFSQQALAEQKGLALENNVPSALDIEADHDRMIQVLVNLVNNAIKFTDQGTITIEAEAEPAAVAFRVRDTGIGIPCESREVIFNKFAQVGNALHRNAGGTGLGLAIVRGIIREHGGDIYVDSEPDRGSCFTLILPQPPRKATHGSAGPLD